MKMLKKLLCLLPLFWGLVGWGQECPDPISPLPGAENVPVTASITWETVDGVPGYSIALGTRPGGDDILPLTSVGGATSYPPLEANRIKDLPENTEIFVTISLFFLNRPPITCDSYSFTTEDVTTPPPCTALASPLDGATNVQIGTSIRWDYSPTSTGYRVFMGTSPGGTDIEDNLLVEDALNWDPPGDLQPETQIYVRIIPENENGPALDCEEFSFTTGELINPPGCSAMTFPFDGEGNVPLSTVLEWTEVPEADGYILSIGTSPFTNDILDNADLGNATQRNFSNLEPNRIYYIRVIPYNLGGRALNCEQTTFSTILGCGPYFDIDGNFIDLSPDLNFPTALGICGDGDNVFSASDSADGYRWYVIPPFGREELLSEESDFTIPGEGEYRLEIYNLETGPTGTFECTSSQTFTVTQSETAVIQDTDVQLGAGVISIEVEVSGIGDYEYALNDPQGPYQDSNRFTNLPIDNYRVYVRDKNGCGISEVLVEPDLTLEGFPKFFTPNGDGINDLWQFIPPPSGIVQIREVFVFDRYGNLLAQIDPRQGWDGTFNGRPMPAADYWFKAVNNSEQEVLGHFSLKR